jgi:hypothetical protein
MRRTGRSFFSQEENLNLLGAGDVRKIATTVGVASPRVEHVTLGLWPTNLLLIGRKS